MIEKLKKIAAIIKEKDNFLIATHKRPDGDCIGSELALALILKKLGKKFQIVNQNKPPEIFEFLPFFKEIRTSYEIEEKYDVALILDCAEWSRIGKVERLARNCPLILNIDHHTGSEGIGTHNYINTNISCTGEIIYNLINSLNMEIDKDIAACLYVAILQDTGRFKYSNTTGKTHRVVSELLNTGISGEEIIRKINEQEKPENLKLYSDIIKTLKTDNVYKIVWCTFKKKLQEKYSSVSGSFESVSILTQLRSLKGFKAHLLFTEKDDGTKVNFRSVPGLDLSSVARDFGGGGHPQACACFVKDNLKNVKRKILKEIKRCL